MTKDKAETYYDRFETLTQDIRSLGHPDLKIFTVAVTATTVRLPYLSAVRYFLVPLHLWLRVYLLTNIPYCSLNCRRPPYWLNIHLNIIYTQVRTAQLRAGSSRGIDGVWVTDASGLPLYTDGLHLITSAQVSSNMNGVPSCYLVRVRVSAVI